MSFQARYVPAHTASNLSAARMIHGGGRRRGVSYEREGYNTGSRACGEALNRTAYHILVQYSIASDAKRYHRVQRLYSATKRPYRAKMTSPLLAVLWPLYEKRALKSAPGWAGRFVRCSEVDYDPLF